MTISWYGEACFLLEAGGIRILIEPPSKESGLIAPRLKSDILISTRPLDNESEAFTIDSPGEYEVKGINILGVDDGANTIYSIEIDEIKIAHLGFLNKELGNEKLEILGESDVILVPAGGIKDGDVLDAEAA